MSDIIKVWLKDGSVIDGTCYCVDKVGRTIVISKYSKIISVCRNNL